MPAGCGNGGNPAPEEPPSAVQPDNTPPVIVDLSAEAAEVQPLGTTRIVCRATDQEGDNLAYRWTATGGAIEGNGASALWTAPQKGGDYSIQVVVSDDRGLTATSSIVIKVPEKPNNPPVIKMLRFTRYNHNPVFIDPKASEKELRDIQALLVVKKLDPVELSVLPSDPDNDTLEYRWISVPGGTIKGDGSTVWWYAPAETGDYNITIEVSDGRGGTASYTITVTVKCCGI